MTREDCPRSTRKDANNGTNPVMNRELIYKEESYAIIGACFSVYKDKGSGFLEPVYQECLDSNTNAS